jgi:hypothetical protein
MACRRRGLPARNGRGFDQLPEEVHTAFAGSLVTALERNELLRALRIVIEGLLSETEDVQELAAKVEPQLRELMTIWEN